MKSTLTFYFMQMSWPVTLWEISAVITTAVCPFAGTVMGTMTVEMDLMREIVVSNAFAIHFLLHM